MLRLLRRASSTACPWSAFVPPDRVSRPSGRLLSMDVIHQKRGRIQIIFGPMFSGKTTELIRIVKRFSIAKRSCLLIKYAKDVRYSVHGVSTHDKQVSTAKACTKLDELREIAEDFDVIGIDEGQFFADLTDFCETMANKGKTVIVAALDGTFQRKPFGNVLELVPLAEEVTKLNAVCVHCSQNAAFSQRIGSETQVEVIGGADKYVATCRECFAMFAKQAQETPATPSTPSVVTKTPEDTPEVVVGESRRRLFSQDSLGSIEDSY